MSKNGEVPCETSDFFTVAQSISQMRNYRCASEKSCASSLFRRVSQMRNCAPECASEKSVSGMACFSFPRRSPPFSEERRLTSAKPTPVVTNSVFQSGRHSPNAVRRICSELANRLRHMECAYYFSRWRASNTPTIPEKTFAHLQEPSTISCVTANSPLSSTTSATSSQFGSVSRRVCKRTVDHRIAISDPWN